MFESIIPNILGIGGLLTIIGTAFYLHRKHVSTLTSRIEMLESELQFRGNYKEQLETTRSYWETQREILEDQLSHSTDRNDLLAAQLDTAEENIKDISEALKSKSIERDRVNAIIARQKTYQADFITSLKDEIRELETKNEGSRSRYHALNSYIKMKFGHDAVLDFHYAGDENEISKRRSQHSRKQRYSKQT